MPQSPAIPWFQGQRHLCAAESIGALWIPQVVSVPLVPHDLQTQSFQLGPHVSSSSALHMLVYQMNSLAVVHFGLPKDSWLPST